MKKSLYLILAIIFAFTLYLPVNAQEAPKKKSDAEILAENIEYLNKKVYAASLFSAEDSGKLIEVRAQLNSMADTKLSNVSQAKLFYDAAFIFKAREYKQDAIQYFGVIAKNFPETVYAKRAINELKNYGIDLEESGEEEE